MSADLDLNCELSEVEGIDWLPRWSFWGVAENFARVQILLTVFDGDPEKWLELIERSASAGDEGDRRFALDMRERIAHDPSLIAELRRIVREFAECFGRVTATA